MEFIKAIIDWICFTGLNNNVAGFLANNSYLVIPAGIVIYKYLQYRASLTPEEWDDQAVDAIGEYIGMEDEDEEEEDEFAKFDRDIGFTSRPKKPKR